MRNYAQVHLFIFTHGFKKKNGGKMRGRGALKAHTNALQTFQERMRGGQRIQGFAGLTSCCGRITRVRRCIRYAFCLQNADLMSWDRVEHATSPSRGCSATLKGLKTRDAARESLTFTVFFFFFKATPCTHGAEQRKKSGGLGEGPFFSSVLFCFYLYFFASPNRQTRSATRWWGGAGTLAIVFVPSRVRRLRRGLFS